MATAKIVLFKSKKLKDDKYPVMLCLRNGDSVKYFGLKQSATISQWDEENGLFKKDKRVNPDISRDVTDTETNRTRKDVIDSYSIRNEYLMSRLLRANEIIKDFEKNNIDWTFQMFEDAFKKKAANKLLFMDYLQTHINALNESGRFGNARSFLDLQTSLNRFAEEKKAIRFSRLVVQDIDTKVIQAYIGWLRARECKDNTVGIYLRAIRTLLNTAINDGVGSKESYPFTTSTDKGGKRIKVSDFKAVTRKRFLPKEYLQKLNETTFDTPVLERAKHLFLFSFQCFGISFADMAWLKHSDIEHSVTAEGNLMDVITYARTKTHKGYRIPITPGLRAEMDWFEENYPTNKNGYLLPIIIADREGPALTEYIVNSRKRYSKELKRIAQILELPEAFQSLSTYFSRHSFAMALRSKGANIDVIQQAMGHTSSSTTETYLASFDDDFMAKMGEDLI